jgi:hypothetical protein
MLGQFNLVLFVHAFLAVFLVLPAIAILPYYLSRLRPDWIRAYFEPDDRHAASLQSRADVREICTRLAALGFRSLGVKVECRPLFGRTRSLVFASTKDSAYASVFRLELRTVVHFFTPLEPNLFLLTSNGRGRPFESEGYCQVVVPDGSVDDMRAAHQKRLQELIDLGYSPQVEETPKARVESGYAFYRNDSVRRMLGAQVQGVWSFYLAALIVAVDFIRVIVAA